jgi:hypothetical protein
MRMLYSNKDGEDRPLRLVKGKPEDTIISNILEDSQEAKIPEVAEEPKKKEKKRTTNGIIPKILEEVDIVRIDTYDSWILIGMICYNEDEPLETWIEASKRSNKFVEGECDKKWNSFKKGSSSISTLWSWLETDNEEAYKKLRENDYKFLKSQIELSYFRLMNPLCYVRVFNKQLQLMNRSELGIAIGNIKYNGKESFLQTWLNDETIKTYEACRYLPKKEVPPNYYNIFTGYAVEAKEGADISIIHKLLRIIANNDDKMFDYIQKWIAHIIQKPYEKTEVALVVIGKQGVGKDTYFNFIGKLLGNKCFYNTSTPEKDVFGRFNAGTEQTLLLKFEEANFKTNKANADALKSLITSETQNIENKGQKTIVLDSFVNIVMTTNHDVPVELEDNERRFVITRTSDEKKGNFDFWDEMYSAMENPDVQSAYLYYLETLDISKFSPKRDRVLNESYTDVKQSFIPYLARWFQSVVENCDEDCFMLQWKSRDLFNEVKSSVYAPKNFDLTETKFGRDINQYVSDGIIEKKKTSSYRSYITNPQKLKEYMEKKGHWADF